VWGSLFKQKGWLGIGKLYGGNGNRTDKAGRSSLFLNQRLTVRGENAAGELYVLITEVVFNHGYEAQSANSRCKKAMSCEQRGGNILRCGGAGDGFNSEETQDGRQRVGLWFLSNGDLWLRL